MCYNASALCLRAALRGRPAGAVASWTFKALVLLVLLIHNFSSENCPSRVSNPRPAPASGFEAVCHTGSPIRTSPPPLFPSSPPRPTTTASPRPKLSALSHYLNPTTALLPSLPSLSPKLCTGRNTGKGNVNRGTTGLLAVAMAMHLCKQVTLFGFGQPRAGTRAAPYHYYTVRGMEGPLSIARGGGGVPGERRAAEP